jgi:plasmid stabilization system protein ParE
MIVKWTRKAKLHLRKIALYYKKERSAKAAEKVLSQIERAAIALKDYPNMAAVEPLLSDMPDTFRSLVVGNQYKIVYTVNEAMEQINIVAIWNCWQNPDNLKNEL